MKYNKLCDGSLNVFLPLLAGLLIYRAEPYMRIPAWIRYHIPDGLWAYAFASCMLIVWDRRIHWPWIIAAMTLSVLYEIGQYYHLIRGIGEVKDVLTYFLSFSLALASNIFFKTYFYNSNQHA
jgi:hypothetical protein